MGNNCCRVEEKRELMTKPKQPLQIRGESKKNSNQSNRKPLKQLSSRGPKNQDFNETQHKLKAIRGQSPKFNTKTEKIETIKLENIELDEKFTERSFEKIRKKPKKQRVFEKVSNLKESKEKDVLKLIKTSLDENDDDKIIYMAFDNHFFIRNLNLETRKKLINQISLYSVNKGTEIFQQGNIGTFFYIVKSGLVEIQIDGKSIKELKNGESFGELALIHGAPRSATVIALEETYLYCIDRKHFRDVINSVNTLNYEENKNFIPQIPLLSSFDEDMKNLLCTGFNKEVHDEGSYIVKYGDLAACMYIVKDGEVHCKNKNTIIRTLKRGDCFGERSILLETFRTLDVVASTKCTVLSISVDTLKNIFGTKYKELIYLNVIKTAFKKTVNFRDLNFSIIENHFDIFKIKIFSKGDFLMKIGTLISEKMVFVIEGNVKDSTTKEIIASRGTLLFEDEIFSLSQKVLKTNLFADPDCLVCECDTQDFLKIGNSKNFESLFGMNLKFDTLSKLALFRYLNSKKIKELCEILKIEQFDENEIIYAENDDSSEIFVVVEGNLEETSEKQPVPIILKEFDIFGEFSFFFNEKRRCTMKSVSKVKLIRINKDKLLSIIDIKLFEFMKNRYFLLDQSIELEDLDFVTTLGSGSYGEVSLVYCKKNKSNYAIKALDKGLVVRESMYQNLDSEKSILLNSDHPFIVKLVKTLKDKLNLYFVLEYVKGKELFDVIRDIGLLKSPETKFYGASLMLAVNYLHEKKCVYRDIKPENIMVSEKGFIKLIDFGTAKKIIDRTSTIIGTPHYMAPEIVLGEGYSFIVDFWSIAICMYEFVVGCLPFGESVIDPINIYKAIINDELKFPKSVKDTEFKKLMIRMLNKQISSRLTKLSSIKESAYFNNFNWDGLSNLDTEVPYIPKFEKKDEMKPKKPFVEQMKKKKKSFKLESLDRINEIERFFNDF